MKWNICLPAKWSLQRRDETFGVVLDEGAGSRSKPMGSSYFARGLLGSGVGFTVEGCGVCLDVLLARSLRIPIK